MLCIHNLTYTISYTLFHIHYFTYIISHTQFHINFLSAIYKAKARCISLPLSVALSLSLSLLVALLQPSVDLLQLFSSSSLSLPLSRSPPALNEKQKNKAYEVIII